MDVDRFIAEGRPRWEALDQLVAAESALDAEGWAELASGWRSLCADLARARGADLPDDVEEWLHRLASRAHTSLYGTPRRWRLRLLERLVVDVPRQVRKDVGWFLLGQALLFVPMLGAAWVAWRDPVAAAAIVPADVLRASEEAFADGASRTVTQDTMMAGFYVWNNVGIALRCFATGGLAGLGPIWFLIYNGAVIGATFGDLFRVGVGDNLLEFVCGHAAWELTAIGLSGAAGMKLGAAMVWTGGRSRRDAIAAVGPEVLTLALGAAAMLMVAAGIEGFWSASPVPRVVKHAFAVVQIAIVGGWLALGGRR
jgi:uncharacterized membrane protein SpoIIM required for sporulation